MLARRRLTLLVGALAIMGCRSSTVRHCDDCTAGGSGGESTAGEAGVATAGGDGSSSHCSRDEDCDDGAACNGAELCSDGACAPGDAFACAAPTECTEQPSAAACSFAPSERFVVYAVNTLNPWWNVVGSTVSHLDDPKQINLSQGASDAEFNQMSESDWSPDGRRLVFPATAVDASAPTFDQKFFWFDVTQPIEGQPRRLPDVPIDPDIGVMAWSPDSNVVLIGTHEFDRTAYYAVRFTETGAETAIVPADGAVELCGDDATVAYEVGGETHLASIWRSLVNEPVDETVLPALLRGRSPDGEWLLLSDDEHAYLAKCGASAKLEALGPPAVVADSWSSDSKYVVYSEQDWDDPSDHNEENEVSNKTLDLFQVDSRSHHEALLQFSSLTPTVDFEPGGARFVHPVLSEQSEKLRYLRDSADSNADRVLEVNDEQGAPTTPTAVTWLRADWLRYYAWIDGHADDPEVAAYSLGAASDAKPRRLVTVAEANWLRFTDDGKKAVWIRVSNDDSGDHSQLFSLDLADNASKPRALFPEPIDGALKIADGGSEPRLLTRDVDFPADNIEIFVAPADFDSAPVSIARGLVNPETISLQPRP